MRRIQRLVAEARGLRLPARRGNQPAMTLDDFDFDLPDDRIALRPVSPRSAARLMVLRGQQIEDAFVNRLPQLLCPGDMLVFNDTAVIPARLTGTRTRPTEHGSGVARIEVTLLEPDTQGVWHALARPAKRLAPGDVIEVSAELRAEVVAKGEAGAVHLRFNESGAAFEAALSAAGSMPLPPYIAAKRAADVRDKTDYQSVFARRPGAVAAPTASLHFDAALLQALEAAGISHAFVTLHVGAGTFLPVKVGDIDNHRMHAEWGQVSDAVADRIRAARAAGGRIIPVGTTALRLIETAARDTGEIAGWEGDTDIFIRPGFRFRATDGLMTNFHLPRSTLLMLVAALIGLETTHRAYAHAIANDYRFFSYGDASLLFPAEA